jgi:hypothetical protein
LAKHYYVELTTDGLLSGSAADAASSSLLLWELRLLLCAYGLSRAGSSAIAP